MLIKAAKNLAKLVISPNVDNILPDPFSPEVVKSVAKAIKD